MKTAGASSRQIVEIAPLIRSGEVNPVDLVRSCLDAIRARRSLNAFILVLEESAMDEAARAGKEIGNGRWRGPLHGVPLAVKDLVDVAGTRTTSGSAVPTPLAEADAPIVGRLRDAGAVIIGKTNLHEFAFGTTSEESAFGPVRNPLDDTRSAGGSSGGSAAALATGMCFGAVGTDTGGSIRIPSAACGTVGLKPTYGELPIGGVVPLSGTLDHIGPMTRSVADAAVLFQAMKGANPVGVPPAAGSLRIGFVRPYFCDQVDESVASTLADVRNQLTRAGHQVLDLEIDHVHSTPDAYLHIVLADAAWYHAPLLERYASSYSPGVRLRIEMGRYVLAEDYVRALKLRETLTSAVDDALDRCDALLVPTQPTAPPVLGATSVEIDGRREPVRGAMLRLTQLFNLTGHPAIALPSGRGREGLPRSVQLVGRRHETERLLAIAGAVADQISGGAGSVGGGTG